jgi:peroxiredoxin Q/BCP
MNIGDSVSAINFTATSGIQTNFADYSGKWLVIYFYPKDNTPGCTIEGCGFRDKYNDFQSNNALIFGVSKDKLASHEKFKAKKEFPFELISDEDASLCKAFDTIKLKSMFGKQIQGIERCTFLIDPSGVVRHIWRKVNVLGHVNDVFKTLELLKT